MTEKKQRIDPIRRVRGMQDFLPERAAGMRRIAGIAEDVARLYGFERIEIPILERASLYRRSLGLGSDVVMKEMYAFEDKNGDELCLRPEGTAGVMRMLIENGLTQTLSQKWFYEGAMFRRERPQKGRFRQFHQCGIEYLHKPERNIHVGREIEIVACAWRFLKKLGLEDIVELKVNWLGNAKERENYSEKLKNYFRDEVDNETLSDESIERLKRNPLRIFDSKDPVDQEAIKKAPKFKLNKDSQGDFDEVQENLKGLKIPCSYDSSLVRGLDYYNGFVFEFVEKDTERAQATVLAGGRYDGLCEELGGKNPVAAIGWAAGLERLFELQKINKTESLDFCMITICLAKDENFKKSEFIYLIEKYRDDLHKNSFNKIIFPTAFSYEEAVKIKPDFIASIVRINEDSHLCRLTNEFTDTVLLDGDDDMSDLCAWLKLHFGKKEEEEEEEEDL